MSAPGGLAGPRDFTYIVPAGRRITEYEALNLYVHTLDSTKDGPVAHPAGWNPSSTAARCQNWFAFRDPAQMWQRPYIKRQAEQERAIERAMATARGSGSIGRMDDGWASDVLGDLYVPAAYFEHALFRTLAHASLMALSDVVGVALVFNSFDKERHAQDILFHHFDLLALGRPVGTDDRREAWLTAPSFQPLRRLAEQLLAADDWAETAVVVNLLVEPVLSRFLYNELIWSRASVHGDPLTPVLLLEAENDRQRNIAWTRELVAMLIADAVDGAHNQALIDSWLRTWLGPVGEAIDALDSAAKLVEVDPDVALATLEREWHELLAGCGLDAGLTIRRAS